MFSPGKKNWIKKFFALQKQGEINLEVLIFSEESNTEERIRELCDYTGVLYGIPNQQLYTSAYVGASTRNEKLQVLLFESLLYVDYLHQKEHFSSEEFINRLVKFYELPIQEKKPKWFQLFRKTEPTHQLEALINDRIKIHSSYSDRNFWFNHLTNGFLYLDVILFYRYYHANAIKNRGLYNQWVEAVLTLFASLTKVHPEASAYFDQTIFKNLTLSSELTDESLKRIKHGKLNDAHYQEALHIISGEPMLAKFTFHFLVFLYHEFPAVSFNKDCFINQFGLSIGLNEEQINEVFWACRKSMSDYSEEFYHLVSDSESKILTTYLARKYYRIIGRNKDKFVQELKESKELVYLVRQSTIRELTPEEKEKVRIQSIDLMKSVPSIGIYLIPGGALWLPLILKLIPDLLPTSFKENEVEEEK